MPAVRVASSVAAPWVPAKDADALTAAPMSGANSIDPLTRAPWNFAAPQASATDLAWGITTPTDTERASPWGKYQTNLITGSRPGWGVTTPTDTERASPWGAYAGRPATQLTPLWVAPLFADLHAEAPWGFYAARQKLMAAVIGPSAGRNPLAVIPWGPFGRALAPGWGIPNPPNEPPTNENGTIVVPTLRSYIVLNNVTLTRSGAPLAARTLRVEIDANTWGWGWSADLPEKHLADLDRDTPDEPVELEAQINGVVWKLLVERVTHTRQFGQPRLSVSGRGLAAQIAAPYYPDESRSNAGALNAQQLADAAITLNGVPLGWTLNWQMADWLVPAGAWVHTGSPMDAVQTIAQAAGGYVQADPVQKLLHVLPRYPLMPWEWDAATPDYILPSAVTTRESTDYIQRPDYNRVFVSGTDIGGIIGQVTRTGTAGDLPAEMIVDPLITHADAARGRGRSILGDTGHQQIMTLDTPVLEAVGLYPVGSLIEWQDGAATRRGIVRSTSVTAAMPRVRQTIEVETHG